MKIVVLDGYTENPGDLSWEELSKLGELTVYDRVSYEESPLIAEKIGDADIAVTNKTPLSARTMDACPDLKAVAVLATGYNVVDVEYAEKKGITVMNVPAYGTEIVAQYAVGLLLEICAHYWVHSEKVHAGEWERSTDWCFWDYPMIELAGKTAGIIGLGRIGRQTARILGAMGMQVLAYSRTEREDGRKVARYVDRETLLGESDVIFLHCPLTPGTEKIIRKDTIGMMKDGVIIINNSRGGLIEEQDLADALNSGKVAAAGLDVVSAEPVRGSNPLLKAKNCIITPHISWAAREARQRIMDITVENVRSFMHGHPRNVVY